MSRIAVDVLLALTVAIALFCAVGMLVMRDAYQRLHYLAPPASVSTLFLAVAVLIGEEDKTAFAKTALIAVLLTIMNAVVSHATARAARIREVRRPDWRFRPDEPLELVEDEE